MVPTCEHCVVPSGFVDWNSTDLLPDSWQPIPDAPAWVRGSRHGGVLRCTACGRHWYLFHDPKEMFFTDIFELPEVTAVLLGPAKLASALRAMDAHGGRFYDGLAAAWLGQADYHIQDCVESLLHRVSRDSDLRDIGRWLFYLRSALSGLSFQEAVKTQRRKGRKPVRLSAQQGLPLQRARERAAQVGSPDRRAAAARIERELDEIEGLLKRWSETPA